MERSHTPLNVWFWTAYLVASHDTQLGDIAIREASSLSHIKCEFWLVVICISLKVKVKKPRSMGRDPKLIHANPRSRFHLVKKCNFSGKDASV